MITFGRHTTSGGYDMESHPEITIGNFVKIGSYTKFWGTVNYPSISNPNLVCNYAMKNHLNFMRHPDISDKGPIVIGNDVWIGSHCHILSGVTIGDGAIIGLGSVVSKNIPPYAIAVGSPIVIKRLRFTKKTIDKLLHIKWWNWEDDVIEERQDDFLDVDLFTKKYYVD